MSPKTPDRYQVRCPKCNKVASPDTSKLPAKLIGKKMQMHFVCPDGHEFVHEFEGK